MASMHYLSTIIKQSRKQQNQMSVFVKEKEINYNDGSYYRANPYANQGYIPTPALRNRKQPQFYSQIPQGVEYFQNSAKKHFPKLAVKSTISQQNLLSNPERYPFENTLANDLQYLRNLSTIDIEGANANSKKSLGVKYRIKAQQELMRRNAKIITPILSGMSEDYHRRKIALQQQQRVNSRQSSLKSNQRIYNSQKKLPLPQFYHRNPYVSRKEEGMQFDINDQLQKELLKQTQLKEEQRHPESDASDLLPSPFSHRNQQYNYDRSEINSNASLGSNFNPQYESTLSPQIKSIFQKEKLSLEKDLIKKHFKSQLRQLNPTNLSYQGSIVRNSGILSNIGKNIMNGVNNK